MLAGARRPVALVGPRHRQSDRWDEVAVFVDGSRASELEARFATDLAEEYGVPLTFMRVLPPPSARNETDVCEGADLRRYAFGALQRHHYVTWDSLHDKDPARGIVGWLGTRSNVLAVLGAHSHPDRSHLRSPSVTAQVLHQTAATVLVVPADMSTNIGE